MRKLLNTVYVTNEKAYLSLDLGTIRTDAPVDTDINSYVVKRENDIFYHFT